MESKWQLIQLISEQFLVSWIILRPGGSQSRLRSISVNCFRDVRDSSRLLVVQFEI